MANQFEQTDPPCEKLFVANIPPYITKMDLNEIFSKFGEVVNVDVPDNKNFGFVQRDSRVFRVLPDGTQLTLGSPRCVYTSRR